MHKVNALPADDPSCGWFRTSRHRQPAPAATGDIKTRWAIIGAGLTGLAAARQLAKNFPSDQIVLIEAQEVGYGTAGRNAGFAIDLPHDIGAKDYVGDPQVAKMILKLNRTGQSIMRQTVEENKIECQMRACGKYQAAIEPKGIAVLEAYQRGLEKIGEGSELIEGKDLPDHIGTSFYRRALYTPSTILIQPSAMVKGMADTLPSNVTLYENTAIRGVEYGEKITLFHKQGRIVTDKLILANNGFGQNFGIDRLKHTMIPLFLYGSLTRQLTEEEQKRLGGKPYWGVIPGSPYGSTVRRTVDNRILIRNSFSFNPNGRPKADCLDRFIKNHRRSFLRRFPMLENVEFEHSWSGYLAMSRNHEGYFGQFAPNVYGALCCNGLGITRGTATGTLLADWLAGQRNDLIDMLLASPGPNKLPPEPFLSIGVNATLMWDGYRAGLES
ncbi:FAD-binding oxidoreductase [Acetobacteraceae bacterium ESL0709]|nr:FAD-binding oxidoreductase [Acetobacteraceae bacterium ESL0697]MDF7678443.1 FAD-binding oxidoreductase [Acetobacteraceae bacterium ESL0709]